MNTSFALAQMRGQLARGTPMVAQLQRGRSKGWRSVGWAAGPSGGGDGGSSSRTAGKLRVAIVPLQFCSSCAPTSKAAAAGGCKAALLAQAGRRAWMLHAFSRSFQSLLMEAEPTARSSSAVKTARVAVCRSSDGADPPER